jgi:hypothetical protein
MSIIHSICVPLGRRSTAMCGIARNRIDSIMNRSVDGRTSNPRPSHSFRPAGGPDAFQSDIYFPFVLWWRQLVPVVERDK